MRDTLEAVGPFGIVAGEHRVLFVVRSPLSAADGTGGAGAGLCAVPAGMLPADVFGAGMLPTRLCGPGLLPGHGAFDLPAQLQSAAVHAAAAA